MANDIIAPKATPHSFLPKHPDPLWQTKIWFATDGDVSWPDLLKIMQDVWKNEETRFNNLNTRGLGVVTASSIITTILGFFSKDLFASSSKPITGTVHGIAQVGTCLALLGLVSAAFVVVFGVLRPGGRSVLGNNDITGRRDPASGDVCQGTAKSAGDINRIACEEYAGMYVGLVERNRYKAYWLSLAYLVFAASVTVSALITAIVIFTAKPR